MTRTRREIVAGVPLFEALSEADLERLCAQLEELSLAKGEVLCREGEPGQTLYVLASGELEVRVGAEPDRVQRRMLPGEFVGEISLLLGSPRTATVLASRPSRLLALSKARFQERFGQNPAVLEQVSRVLAQRLATASGGASARAQTVAVFAREGVAGGSLVSAALAALLQAFSGRRALLLRLVPDARAEGGAPAASALALEPADRVCARAKPDGAGVHHLDVVRGGLASAVAFVHALDQIASKLEAEFPIVVFDLGAAPRVDLAAAAELADVVVEVSKSAEKTGGKLPAGVRHYLVLNRFHADAQALPIRHCEPFVIRPDVALLDLDPFAQARRIVDYPREPAAPALRRLARKILGRSLGLALGGGAAFGIAHVGVFQVLEANGIEVDLVAGTSMGSIVALGYAVGLEPAEMFAIAQRIGHLRTILSALDFTVTRPGLLAGNRIVEIFSPLFGSVQSFEGLMFPCQTVAADIESGERVCIGTGALADAFRASCSVPMLWSPVQRDGRTLVDGGMVDPVPAEVVREMGADVCVAINAVPALRRGVQTVLSRAYRQLNALNPLAWLGESRGLPSTFDTVMNAIQALQHELGAFKAISADVRIDPELADFTWVEFYRPLEIIERGARATEDALPRIRAALERRAR